MFWPNLEAERAPQDDAEDVGKSTLDSTVPAATADSSCAVTSSDDFATWEHETTYKRFIKTEHLK